MSPRPLTLDACTSKHTAASFIARTAEVAAAVGWQAGVGAMELAGQIVSVLHANPEHIDRFMAEGVELFHDGTFDIQNGSLTYMSIGAGVISPTVKRQEDGRQQ